MRPSGDRAGEVCHVISGLLDKRRYRMLRLFYAVEARTPRSRLR